MGRNRNKGGSVGAITYDIFGNEVPQPRNQGNYMTADLRKASLEELQQMRRDIDKVFDPAMRNWENAQEQALYTLMDTAPTVEDIAVGDLLRSRGGDERQGRQERFRILTALGNGTPPEQIIPYKITKDPDITDQEFLDSKIGKRYVERLRQQQPALMEAYSRFIGLNDRYQAIGDAIEAIIRTPKPAPKLSGGERAMKAISDTFAAITLDGQGRPDATSVKAADLEALSDADIAKVREQASNMIEDTIGPEITKILLRSDNLGSFGIAVDRRELPQFRRLFRGVDVVAQVESKIQRELLRRTMGVEGAPTQAQVELNVIPSVRNNVRGFVNNEIRQRKRRGEPVPDWATDAATIDRLVNQTLDFEPIQARNR